jgi:hypothetical protein
MYYAMQRKDSKYVICSKKNGALDWGDIEYLLTSANVDDIDNLQEKYSILNSCYNTVFGYGKEMELIAFKTEQLADYFIEDFLNPLQTLISLQKGAN